jgi:hypothetical protein
MTVGDLLELYRAEGIGLGPGMESRPGVRRNPSYRHVLDHGTGLFTPHPHSMGYKRLMYTHHSPWELKSQLGRNAARRIRVQQEETDQEELR